MEYRKSKLNPGSRVWIYARHSPGPNQSIASQLGALRQYCAQNKLVIVEEFIDAGVSGTKTKRNDFSRMIQAAEGSLSKLVDGIVFFDSSRLARNTTLAKYVKAMLRYRGYELEFLDREYGDNLLGEITEVFDDHQNADYIKKLSYKTKVGLREFISLKDETGNYLGTWPFTVPWGYKPVQKMIPVYDTIAKEYRRRQCIEPNYDLWPLGQEIFKLRADGLTYRQIEDRTRFFTNRNVDVTNQDMLGRMYLVFFRNPIYRGELHYKEIVIPNYAPAMVPDSLWRAANQTAWNKKRGNWNGNRYPKAGKGNPVFALAGLCKCAYCNAPCYPISQKDYRYYVCSTRRRAGVQSCPESKPPNAAILESAVRAHAESTFLGDDFLLQLTGVVNALLSEVPDNSARIKQIEREAFDLTRRINNLLDYAEEGQDVKDRLQRLGQQQQEKQAERQRLIDERPEPLQTDLNEVAEIFLNLRQRLSSSDEDRSVFNQIINFVKIAKDKATVYYRMPLYFADIQRTLDVDNLQLEYTIVLPTAIKHADEISV